ncbi:MAG: DUF1361 domain-containing protein [Nostocaceae cyanobacterium]|nr:DUF1361 domain-containing protein [Nostocaceae cyanobacterium]
MKPELTNLTFSIWHILRMNLGWMVWNSFLAWIPLGLSVWLFRGKLNNRSWIWWLGLLVFYGFLPNAPYLLTDVIHLIDDIRSVPSVWLITLVLIPVYSIVILSGFGAYTLSLINLGYYLQRIGKSQWVGFSELLTHFLCAIGVYLGRFLRFNTWDFITDANALAASLVDDVLRKVPLLIIAVTFVVISVLYWIAKKIILGVIEQRLAQVARRKQRSNKPDPLL